MEVTIYGQDQEFLRAGVIRDSLAAKKKKKNHHNKGEDDDLSLLEGRSFLSRALDDGGRSCDHSWIVGVRWDFVFHHMQQRGGRDGE